jgi:hypothetical protein
VQQEDRAGIAEVYEAEARDEDSRF